MIIIFQASCSSLDIGSNLCLKPYGRLGTRDKWNIVLQALHVIKEPAEQ